MENKLKRFEAEITGMLCNVDVLGSDSLPWQSSDLVHCLYQRHCLHVNVYIPRPAKASQLL